MESIDILETFYDGLDDEGNPITAEELIDEFIQLRQTINQVCKISQFVITPPFDGCHRSITISFRIEKEE